MDCYQSLFRVVLMGVVAEKQRFVASAMGLHWVLSLSMFRHSAFAPLLADTCNSYTARLWPRL